MIDWSSGSWFYLTKTELPLYALNHDHDALHKLGTQMEEGINT